MICLLETWCGKDSDHDEICNVFLDYQPFILLGTKRKKQGRYSGGIIVLIKKGINKHFKRTKQKFKHGIIFDVQPNVCSHPVILIITYLPPEGAKTYGLEEPNGVCILEKKILEVKRQYQHHHIIVSGDFNARTKNQPVFIINDSANHLPLPDSYDVDTFAIPRNSKDLHGEVNAHGKALLSLCCSLGLHMLNGRVIGDLKGELSCFTARGSSTVDYTLASTALFEIITRFEIGEEDQYTHLPQMFKIKISAIEKDSEEVPEDHQDHARRKRARFRWNPASLDKLTNNSQLSTFYEHLENSDIDEAVLVLTTLLQDVCSPQNVNRTKNDAKKHTEPWWDAEMDQLKYLKYKCLRTLKYENSDTARTKYVNVRNKYNKCIREKKMRYQHVLRNKIESCSTPTEFWKMVKSLSGKAKQCINKITPEDWNSYFYVLLNTERDLNESHTEKINGYMSSHDLHCQECTQTNNEDDVINKDFTMPEIESVLVNLQRTKSPGIDGISNDILINSKIIIVPLLCDLFNTMLRSGEFPTNWCEAIIYPIHKIGGVNNPNNYRGIALLSCISKLFTKIINARLVSWATNNNKMSELQAGFTKGKSTIDHIFVLQSLVSKYLSRKKDFLFSIF